MKNNKFVILFTFFIITLFIPNFVHAEVYSCPKLLDSVSEYYDINEELDTLVCENTDDNDVVMKCNDLNTRKALLLSKIFKYNDKIGDTCNSPELKKIIEDNQSICKNAFGSTLKDLTNSVMTLFYIIAPFLLIIFGSIDLAKIVTGGGGKEFSEQLTKSKKNLAKRVIAFVLLYMTPVIVNIILGFNLSSYSLNGDFYTCKTKTTYTLDRWEVTYIPNNVGNGGTVNSKGVDAIMDAAEIISSKYHRESWSYGTNGIFNGIVASINNSYKETVCATYINQVLYTANIFDAETIDKEAYNSAGGTAGFLSRAGWIQITNYDDLKKGDIVFMDYSENHCRSGVEDVGHVQLYAGNGLWYNAGSTNAILNSPYEISDSYVKSRFRWAFRMP